MKDVARQLVRALRGHRSQIQLARRLGYRTNPVAEWEGGRRRPRVTTVLRIAELGGVDVDAAFRRFSPSCSDALDEGIGPWLDRLRGHTTITELARRSGASRHQVARVLSGKAEARLPEFLLLVEAMTGRVVDLVAEIADIDSVPAIRPLHRRLQAARNLAYDEPWSSAVVAALDVAALARVHGAAQRLAAHLGLPIGTVRSILETLRDAGAIRVLGDRYVVDRGLTVDARVDPGRMRHVKRHWNELVGERTLAPRPDDLLAFNVFSISDADLQRLRSLQRAYFREIRSMVAASEPAEHVVLLQMHVLCLSEPASSRPGA